MRNSRRAGWALIAAAGMTTVIVALHPEVPSDPTVEMRMIAGDLVRWNLVHGLVLLDAVLWLAAGLGLAALLRSRAGTMAMAGGTMTTIGSVALAAIGASEVMLGKIASGTGGSLPPGLVDELQSAGAVDYLIPFVLLLTIGLAVIATGLARSGLSRWPAVVILVSGTVLSNPPIPHVVNVVGQVMQLVGAVWMARTWLASEEAAPAGARGLVNA